MTLSSADPLLPALEMLIDGSPVLHDCIAVIPDGDTNYGHIRSKSAYTLVMIRSCICHVPMAERYWSRAVSQFDLEEIGTQHELLRLGALGSGGDGPIEKDAGTVAIGA